MTPEVVWARLVSLSFPAIFLSGGHCVKRPGSSLCRGNLPCNFFERGKLQVYGAANALGPRKCLVQKAHPTLARFDSGILEPRG